MFVQPMSSYIRVFYIWVFPKPKYRYINSIRVLVLWEKGIWLREEKKTNGHCSRVQGWSYRFLSSTFWEILMVCFLLDFFLFMFPRVVDSQLKWELSYYIPIYWNGRNFLRGFLPIFKGFFLVIFGVLFCGWMFLIVILNYY